MRRSSTSRGPGRVPPTHHPLRSLFVSMSSRRWLPRLALLIAAATAALWLGNQSSFGFAGSASPLLLAHRGVHQTFPLEGVGPDTCTAARVRAAPHALLENTLPSMRAAFALGAHRVEIDLHPTTDGEFVVFHDWTLDCRTDGHGVTREHTLVQLKRLDVGHGYTADNGKTYPFRGSGVGQMPSLREVLAAFPTERFLVHVKSRDADEGRLLAQYLRSLDNAKIERLLFYGSNEPLSALEQALPEARASSDGELKRCLIQYLALGWAGRVPSSCRGGMMLLPSNIAPWMWGWPHRLVERLRAADSELFVLAPYTGGGFNAGIDDVAALRELPPNFSGGIWTNRIEVIAPAIGERYAVPHASH